jgi:hypothetical protein
MPFSFESAGRESIGQPYEIRLRSQPRRRPPKYQRRSTVDISTVCAQSATLSKAPETTRGGINMVRRPAISALIAVAVAVSAAGCERRANRDFTPIEAPSVSGPAIQMRPGSMTSEVDLVVGQTLAVELDTHFNWREESAPTLLRQIDTLWGPADRATRDDAVTGGRYWKVFVYRAERPGEETLRLVEAREWEPETITDRYTLTVRVRPPAGDGQTPAS